jgi:hypothetical protein
MDGGVEMRYRCCACSRHCVFESMQEQGIVYLIELYTHVSTSACARQHAMHIYIFFNK